MEKQLYVAYLSFKVPFENVGREFLHMGKAIGGWCRPVLHGRYTAGFVFVSEESIEAVKSRLSVKFDNIEMLDNYWFSPAPSVIKGKYGSIDPFATRIMEGWDRIRQSRYAKYMGKSQTG